MTIAVAIAVWVVASFLIQCALAVYVVRSRGTLMTDRMRPFFVVLSLTVLLPGCILCLTLVKVRELGWESGLRRR